METCNESYCTMCNTLKLIYTQFLVFLVGVGQSLLHWNAFLLVWSFYMMVPYLFLDTFWHFWLLTKCVEHVPSTQAGNLWTPSSSTSPPVDCFQQMLNCQCRTRLDANTNLIAVQKKYHLYILVMSMRCGGSAVSLCTMNLMLLRYLVCTLTRSGDVDVVIYGEGAHAASRMFRKTFMTSGSIRRGV